MDQTAIKNESIEWIKAIIITVILALLINTFVLSTSIVQGKSMSPTLQNGDRIIFNKFVYIFGKPHRGDVVIIQRPHKNYVKRVIALPGETIEMNEQTLLIDGEPIEELFLDPQIHQETRDFGPFQVPEDSYFVMGDNRKDSKDSRNGLGFIKEDHIVGRSELIFYPFSEWSFIR